MYSRFQQYWVYLHFWPHWWDSCPALKSRWLHGCQWWSALGTALRLIASSSSWFLTLPWRELNTEELPHLLNWTKSSNENGHSAALLEANAWWQCYQLHGSAHTHTHCHITKGSPGEHQPLTLSSGTAHVTHSPPEHSSVRGSSGWT